MKNNLEMVRGDTLSFAFEVEFDEAPQKLGKADFTCKENFDDDVVLFHKELEKGINFSKQDGTKLYYIVRIAPEDTKYLEAGMYYYDLSIELNGDAFTILDGALKIESDVTRNGDMLDDMKILANQIKLEMSQIKADTNTLKEKANTSATNAKTSEAKAKEYADNLKASTDDISKLKSDIAEISKYSLIVDSEGYMCLAYKGE